MSVGQRCRARVQSVVFLLPFCFGVVDAVRASDGSTEEVAPPPWAASAPLSVSPAILAQADVLPIDIPAQPLSDALSALSRQTGLQFFADSALTQGITAPAVAGRMTADEALQRLLAGSGLSHQFTGAGAVTLRRAVVEPESGPARLAPITVEAVLAGTLTDSYAAPDNFAATRTDTPTIDTPQSTQAVTRQALEDAGATDIADAYDYLAGINREDNFGGIEGDRYIARGFETDNILFNGNRTGQPTTLDTANVERVEAIRGPTATLFGRADPGGLVNVVTKQPLAEPLYQADLQGGVGFFGDGSRYRDVRATVDTGGPIDEQGRLRYRFNAAAQSERSFRKDVDEKRFFVSPVIDFELDDRTIANLELTYQYRDFVFDRGLPFIDGEPELPTDWYVGEGQAPGMTSNYASGTLRVDRELDDALTARLGVYASYNSTDGSGIQQLSVNGTQSSASRFDADISDLFLTVQPELVAEFGTGNIGHTVLFGIDASYQRNRLNQLAGPAGPDFDVFDPDFPVIVPDVDLSLTGASLFDQRTTERSIGLYIEDQVDITDQWKLLAGLRWDAVWIQNKAEISLNPLSPPPITDRDEDFTDNVFLPRIGLVYQPIKEVGLYASYAETYRPPTGFALTDSTGQDVEPEEGQSFELGIKLEAFNGALSGTLAAFRADKDNVLEPDPDDPFAISVTNLGKVRSQGVEFDLAGEVFENFSLGVSYAFTDAQIDSNDNPNLPKGTRLRNVPRHAASLQAAYRFTEGPLQGLRLFGGIVYEDDRRTNTSATIDTEMPSYLRFDAGASYDLSDSIQARLFIQNLTDNEYYTQAAGEANVFPGQPFNATLGVRVRF